MLLTIFGGLQSDFYKNLTEFYQISLKNLPYLTDFSPQLMVCMQNMYRENEMGLNAVLPVREFQIVPIQGK